MDLFLLIAEEPKGLGWLLLQIVPLLVCHWYGCASFSFPWVNHFHYHWGCGKNKIIQLCFADDLLMFSKGTVSLLGY